MESSGLSRLVSTCIDRLGVKVAASPMIKRLVPPPVRRWFWAQRRSLSVSPPLGRVPFRKLRRVTPVSRIFGFDRGLPIDRYYIEGFLSANRSDIRGRVLEISENKYTGMFGDDRVRQSDVLHVCEGNPDATIITDLTSASAISSDSFDTVIITQTLHLIYELRPTIRTLHRILKPGGTVLATLPGISQISRYDMDRWGDCWRFTTFSARKLFEEVFTPADINIECYGNVLAANGFLHGLAVEDLRSEELEYKDHDYELLIGVRAVKGEDNEDNRGRSIQWAAHGGQQDDRP
jgi:SAM-dependent methyltransferase